MASSCPTLCNLMNCSTPGSSFHGILQTRILDISFILKYLLIDLLFFSCSVMSNSFWHPGLQHTRILCLSFTISWSLHKLVSTELVMPSNHLIFCHPLLLLCSIFTRLSSVQLLSHVQLCVTPWTSAFQASLSITNSQSLLKLIYSNSIESVMPTSHLILCHPRLYLSSIFPSIRVFSNESALCIRWPKYWSFSFIISPSSEYSGLISFRMD